MQPNIDVAYEIGDAQLLAELPNLGALPVCVEEAVALLAETARILLKDTEVRRYPDVVTWAFWCREASVRSRMSVYLGERRRGRGMVFHIAPSNVAVNFAYSFVAGLLAGNANVVRLPSRDFRQTALICNALRMALERVPTLRPYVIFVRYGHERAVNDVLSALCTTRVIWGGDAAIRELRHSELPPRANEITFADRYSVAVFDADAYLAAEDKERLAKAFFNDTYLTDQNACSAPCLVVWRGARVEEAREVFWQELHREVQQHYELQPVQAVDKLTQLALLADAYEVRLRAMPDMLITRAELGGLDAGVPAYRMHSGFFMEYCVQDLSEIVPICGSRCQTVVYYGIDPEEIRALVDQYHMAGVDRIVPVGESMAFSLVWDGIDLIRTMSRCIG